MDDLYFEINPNESKILGPPINLDINWNNISGIVFLNKEELYDLSWAGYSNIGFIKICSDNKNTIKSLYYDSNILNLVKSKWKSKVSENRKQIELIPLEINNSFSIQLTERCKSSIIMKYHECLGNENLKFNWKTLSGFFEFDSKMFLNLYAKIQNYIQNLFELEYKIHKKIEECENISNLMDLDLEILYDNKILL
jgi:hypothetical protein